MVHRPTSPSPPRRHISPDVLVIGGGNSMHVRNLRCMHVRPQDVLVDAYPEEEFWQDLLDCGFIALLFFSSLTGLALLIRRDSGAMVLLLALHLGVVMALFITLPYGKFAHAGYRCAALLKYAIEKRQPNRLPTGAE